MDHAGDRPGLPQIMKLTNNMLCAVALVATSEAMTMSGKAGIPDDAMLQILNNGTGRNFATMRLFPDAVLPRTFDFRCLEAQRNPANIIAEAAALIGAEALAPVISEAQPATAHGACRAAEALTSN